MAVAEAAENYARSVLEHLTQQAERGQPQEAFMTGYRFICEDRDRRAQMWNRYHEEIIKKMFTAAVFNRGKFKGQEAERNLKQCIKRYRLKTESQPESRMDVLLFLVDELDAHLKETEEKFVEGCTKETLELRVMKQFTGQTSAQLLAVRLLDSAMMFYMDIMYDTLNTIGFSGSLESLYQKILRRSMEICVRMTKTGNGERPRGFEFERLSRHLSRHTRESMTRPDQREAVLGRSENIRQIFYTKHVQLQSCRALKRWSNVVMCINDTQQFLSTLRRWEKIPRREEVTGYYQELSRCLFECNAHSFHALTAIRAAKTGFDSADAQLLACRAVLSVLRVTELAAVDSLHVTAEAEQRAAISKALNTTAPTRSSLVLELTQPMRSGKSLLETVPAPVAKLFNALVDVSSLNICREVKPLLDKIETIPELLCYITPLQDVAVRAMLTIMSRAFVEVQIEKVQSLCAFFEPEEFAARVEPIVISLCNDDVFVALDVAASCVRFSKATQATDTAIGLQSVFAERLALSLSACVRQGPAPVEKKSKTAAKNLMAAIAADRERVTARYFLCGLRIDKADDRVKDAQRREKERREKENMQRRQQEETRVRKVREAELGRLEKKVAEQEAVERRRWVLKHVMNKHKGFHVDYSLAKETQDTFTEELTKKLLAFRREAEMKRSSDARAMDHFERACREVEVPRRMAHDEALAAATVEEFEQRRQNQLEQHRADYEEKLKTKERLGRFSDDARAYEKELEAAVRGSVKKTKRDQQQEDLEKEMAAREVAAAEAREEEAAMSPPPAAEPKASPPPAAPFGGGAGKWVPKSRAR